MSYYHMVLSSYETGNPSNVYINSFTYLTSEIVPTTAGAAALAGEWEYAFLTNDQWLRAIVTSDTTFDALTVKAPTVPSVLHIEVLSGTGNTSTPAAPDFTVVEFYSPRKVGNIRPGFKRFGKVSNTNAAGGIPPVSYEPFLEDMATALSSSLNASVGGSPVVFTPIVVKRVKYTTSSGSIAYRLPEGLDPFVYYIADNWVFSRVTTQNSRKR